MLASLRKESCKVFTQNQSRFGKHALGLAAGEPQYDDLEKKLAQGPVIAVPTITLEGDANGAPHPDAASYGKKFSGKYAHRIISGGVGHNLPQEAPQAFAQAIIDVDRD